MRSFPSMRRLNPAPASLTLMLGLTFALAACERRAAPETVIASPSSAAASSNAASASQAAVPNGATALAVAAPASGSAVVDRYDVSKMDFKSPPAVLSNERHTGPFASGNALSIEAAIKPLDPAPVKEIRLDTTHKIIEIAPGVKFSAWTSATRCRDRRSVHAWATASSSR